MSKATIEHDKGAAAAGDHGAHPTEAFYIKIALILAVVTGAEVALYYIDPPDAANISILLVMAAVKFAMVAAYFMHLRFDSRILRRLFLSGLVLAILVYVAYLMTLGVFI
ncbi:MAG: cytochrome C oxidase subunit IV family protein [Actinobacteria bacterium]|nr:cytochrome C oxidase subunit IV family protein [Actinomycetota bacterium]